MKYLRDKAVVFLLPGLAFMVYLVNYQSTGTNLSPNKPQKMLETRLSDLSKTVIHFSNSQKRFLDHNWLCLDDKQMFIDLLPRNSDLSSNPHQSEHFLAMHESRNYSFDWEKGRPGSALFLMSK